jgi:YVTN family beta-propeller protein
VKAVFAIVVSLVSLLMVAQPDAQTTAYMPNQGDHTITRALTAGATFDSVALADSPYGAAVTPDGVYLFVTRSGADRVTRIPTNNFTNTAVQINIDVGDDPRGVAVEPQGDYAYVANYGGDTVSKINISSTTVVETISVGNGPLGVAAAFDQDESTPKVYVTNNLGNSLTMITDTDKITLSNICNAPAGVSVTPNGNYVYVACTDDDTVKVVQSSSNTVIDSIAVGDAPWGIAVGSDGRYLFVTNSGADTVSVITISDNTVIETPAVGDTPMGVAAPRNGDFAYVVNQVDNSIHKIDMTTDPATVTEIGSGELDAAISLGAFIGGAPPLAPSNLTAVTVEGNDIDLTWDDNASDELGFKIERREDTDTVFVQIAKVDANETTYTDFGLSGETTYHYRVRAYNEVADSDYSTSASDSTDDEKLSWCFINSLFK